MHLMSSDATTQYYFISPNYLLPATASRAIAVTVSTVDRAFLRQNFLNNNSWHVNCVLSVRNTLRYWTSVVQQTDKSIEGRIFWKFLTLRVKTQTLLLPALRKHFLGQRHIADLQELVRSYSDSGIGNSVKHSVWTECFLCIYFFAGLNQFLHQDEDNVTNRILD